MKPKFKENKESNCKLFTETVNNVVEQIFNNTDFHTSEIVKKKIQDLGIEFENVLLQDSEKEFLLTQRRKKISKEDLKNIAIYYNGI